MVIMMTTEEKVREYIIDYYAKCKNTIFIDFLYKAPVNYIEEYLMDDDGNFVSGRKMIFDIRGLEANYITYPQIYRKFVDATFTEKINDYNDMKVMHMFTTLIRNVNKIKNEE